MSNYRQIHTRMWSSDTWFSSLKPEFKLLFVYLFSNERASACGLYEIPLRIISFETGLLREQVAQGFEIFAKADKVKYDPETGVVWVRNMLKYQASSSPKLAGRIEADIKAVPDCGLKTEALETLAPWRLLSAAFGGPSPDRDRRSADTVSIPYGYGSGTPLSASVPAPIPDSVPARSGEGVQGEGVRGDREPRAAPLRAEPQSRGSAAAGQPPERRAVEAYERNIGAITPFIAEALLDDVREYGAEWVCAAIDEAVRSEARNLKYAQAILARWKRDGFRSARPSPGGGSQGEGHLAIVRKVSHHGTKPPK